MAKKATEFHFIDRDDTTHTSLASEELHRYVAQRKQDAKKRKTPESPDRIKYLKSMRKAVNEMQEIMHEGVAAGVIPDLELYRVNMCLMDIGMMYQDSFSKKK